MKWFGIPSVVGGSSVIVSRRVRWVGAWLVIGISLVGSSVGLRAARADQVLQETVDFGVPQTTVVTGLDFQATCSVVASYQGIVLLDESSSVGSIGVGPGSCSVVVTVLGVPISLPILKTTPLGRFSFLLPVSLPLGLGDVSIDLVTGLYASYAGTSPALDVAPHDIEWTSWGTTAFGLQSHAGTEGDLLALTAPYQLAMSFGVGVSVTVLGLRVFTVDLASLGSFIGSPVVDTPVTVDLRPTHVNIVAAAAPDSNSIQVSWTQNQDSDFASYRVVVNDDANRYVFVVDSQGTTSLTVPARPDKTYAVQVGVVDRAGQISSWSSGSVTTPAAPPAQSASRGMDSFGAFLIPLTVIGWIVGPLVGWFAGRRRRTGRPGP